MVALLSIVVSMTVLVLSSQWCRNGRRHSLVELLSPVGSNKKSKGGGASNTKKWKRTNWASKGQQAVKSGDPINIRVPQIPPIGSRGGGDGGPKYAVPHPPPLIQVAKSDSVDSPKQLRVWSRDLH